MTLTRRQLLRAIGCLALWSLARPAPAEPWTVVDAVQSAISTHPKSSLAESLVEEARGEYRASWALPPPRFDIRWDDIPSHSGLANFKERRIGVSQEFEFPLRYVWLGKAANSAIAQAQNEGRAILLDLESEVRQIYLEAWSSQEQVKTLETYRDSLAIYSSYIQEISQAGGFSPMDARRTRVRALDAENDLRAAQRSLVASIARLSWMTKCDLTDIELISPLETDPVDTAGIVTSNLFASNPEILTAQSAVGVAGYERTLATTAWLPELDLTYFYREEIDPDNPESWAVELELTVPIWFWWGGWGEVKASKAKFNGARAELASSQLEVSSEYTKALQELKSAYEAWQLSQLEELPLARDEYRMVYRNFPYGTGNYLDLVETQDDLKDVQLDNVEKAFDLYEKKIALDRLVGKSIGGGLGQGQ